MALGQSLFIPCITMLHAHVFLAYVPNQYAAYIFGALYALAFIAIFLRTAGNRAWWTLCLPIGAFFEALGFFLRLAVRQNQDSTGLYIVM